MRRADIDRATGEVISIVRELLEVEEQLAPLEKRKAELEAQLEPWINVEGGVVQQRVEGKLKEAYESMAPKVFAGTTEPDAPPNRMTQKANPLQCPFSGCNYVALSKADFADHIAGCQPNDA